MSKRAEQAAEEYFRGSNPYREHPEEEWKKEGFTSGYEQAEQDLALTWEDIKTIVDIYDDCLNITFEKDKPAYESEEFYEEVLRRFREMKNK